MESKSNHRKRKIDEQFPAAVASASAPPPSPPWIELPGEVTANILQRLDAIEILESAQKVCTTWRRVSLDPAIWRVIHLKKPGDMGDQILTMCRLAVKRSQGQLIDLSIDYIGDDELLNFIVDRSSNLKCLSLNRCFKITGEGLSEVVGKLPELEELHIAIMPSVKPADVGNIGVRSRKTLKSFSLRGCPEYELITGQNNVDDCALVIAEAMRNLRHLGLIANRMTNVGLEAILDGCPHLESLDLRLCSSLELGWGLGKRCREQIKDLKLPSDPISAHVQLNPCLKYDSWYSDILYADWFDCYYGYDDCYWRDEDSDDDGGGDEP